MICFFVCDIFSIEVKSASELSFVLSCKNYITEMLLVTVLKRTLALSLRASCSKHRL